MNKKSLTMRYKILVLCLNFMLAAMSLANLFTVMAGAVEVEVPDEDDFTWIFDTEEERLTFIAGFKVKNHGLYDITNLDINALLKTESDNILVNYRQEDLTIPRGSSREYHIIAYMPFENINMSEWYHLMTHDSVFYLDVDIDALYLWGLSTFIMTEHLEYPWEAPFKEDDSNSEYHDIERYLHSDLSITDMIANYLMEKIVPSLADSLVLELMQYKDISIRLEGWPSEEENTSLIFGNIEADILRGLRHVTIGFTMIIKKEADSFDIEIEDVEITYNK